MDRQCRVMVNQFIASLNLVSKWYVIIFCVLSIIFCVLSYVYPLPWNNSWMYHGHQNIRFYMIAKVNVVIIRNFISNPYRSNQETLSTLHSCFGICEQSWWNVSPASCGVCPASFWTNVCRAKQQRALVWQLCLRFFCSTKVTKPSI